MTDDAAHSAERMSALLTSDEALTDEEINEVDELADRLAAPAEPASSSSCDRHVRGDRDGNV